MQAIHFLYRGMSALLQRFFDILPIKGSTATVAIYSAGRSKRARLRKNQLQLTNIRGWSLHGLQLLRTNEQCVTWMFVQKCAGMHLPVWLRNHDSYQELCVRLQEEAINMPSGSMDLSTGIYYPTRRETLPAFCALFKSGVDADVVIKLLHKHPLKPRCAERQQYLCKSQYLKTYHTLVSIAWMSCPRNHVMQLAALLVTQGVDLNTTSSDEEPIAHAWCGIIIDENKSCRSTCKEYQQLRVMGVDFERPDKDGKTGIDSLIQIHNFAQFRWNITDTNIAHKTYCKVIYEQIFGSYASLPEVLCTIIQEYVMSATALDAQEARMVRETISIPPSLRFNSDYMSPTSVPDAVSRSELYHSFFSPCTTESEFNSLFDRIATEQVPCNGSSCSSGDFDALVATYCSKTYCSKNNDLD